MTNTKMKTPTEMTSPAACEVTWRVIGWREAVYQACVGAPVQSAGTCEKCGQGIRYVVRVKSSEGTEMDVGQDCAVTLEGGIELRDMRTAERAYAHKVYLESPEYARAEGMRAGAEFARRERALGCEVTFGLELHGFRLVAKSPNVTRHEQSWAASVVEGILDGRGSPLPWNDDSDKRSPALLVALAQLPRSTYAGDFGMKIDRVAIFEACIPFEGSFGRSYVQKFRCTDDGAVLV